MLRITCFEYRVGVEVLKSMSMQGRVSSLLGPDCLDPTSPFLFPNLLTSSFPPCSRVGHWVWMCLAKYLVEVMGCHEV